MTQGTVDSIEILPMSAAMTDEALEARDSFLGRAGELLVIESASTRNALRSISGSSSLGCAMC